MQNITQHTSGLYHHEETIDCASIDGTQHYYGRHDGEIFRCSAETPSPWLSVEPEYVPDDIDFNAIPEVYNCHKCGRSIDGCECGRQ